MADSRKVAEKFVNILNKSPDIAEDNTPDLPIEYYEIRELAKRRVQLKSSVKAHFVIYCVVNVFLLILNIWVDIWGKSNVSIFDVWVILVVMAWGILLCVHWTVYKTDQWSNYGKKMFMVDVAVMSSLNPFLIYMNYYMNYVTFEGLRYTPRIWWPWILVICIIVLCIHYYLAFYIRSDKRLDRNVKNEMAKLTKEKGLNISVEDMIAKMELKDEQDSKKEQK
jgi:cation transport ATPase